MNEHEAKTIAAFIAPEKRGRWLALLGNPKRRRDFLDCLNHAPGLDARRAEDIPSATDVVRLLGSKGCPEEVYVISDVEELDGRCMPLARAITEIEAHGLGRWYPASRAGWHTTAAKRVNRACCSRRPGVRKGDTDK